MAKGTDLDKADKIRVLKALAFLIHRKRPADEAMGEVMDQESRGGRNRAFRPAKEALEAGGFMAAIRAIDLLGEEASAVMEKVVEAGDHRLISSALTGVAEWLDGSA